jgi:hypothetical protein
LKRDIVALITERPGEEIIQLEELATEQPDPIEEVQELLDNILNSDGRVTIREVRVEEKDESSTKGLFSVIVKLDA